MIETEYLTKVFDKQQFKRTVGKLAKAINVLQPHRKFSAIACCGASGMLMAAPVSLETGLPLIIVRKGRSHHSSMQVEGYFPRSHYIIVDDFFHKGNTLKRIIKKVFDWSDQKPDMIFLYDYEYGERVHVQGHYYYRSDWDGIPVISLGEIKS